MKLNWFKIPFMLLCVSLTGEVQSQWKTNDMARPHPPVVSFGKAGVPSDAEILFNGSEISAWRNKDGTAASWNIIDSCLVITKEWNDIRTLRNYGDCQFHIEFMISTPVTGSFNMHGNSGIIFMGKYEIQIMDSYRYPTFADGQNASVYGQDPPLVDASLPPDKWQSYDIVFTRPRFGTDGELRVPGRITMFHNGVLVHHEVELKGESSWLGELKYKTHPDKLPLVLQSHVQPVRFRNIWIRDLEPAIVNPYTKETIREITLPPDIMSSYAGEYTWIDPAQPAMIADKGTYLEAFLPGNARRTLVAYENDKFFAVGIELWFDFIRDSHGKVIRMEMNAGGNVVLFPKK